MNLVELVKSRLLELFRFEWAQVCAQLSSLTGLSPPPPSIKPEHLPSLLSSVSGNRVASEYFRSYFADLHGRMASVDALALELCGKRRRRIKKFNAPRGVHHSRSGYYAAVSVFGERVLISPTPDADAVAGFRRKIISKLEMHANDPKEDQARVGTAVKEAIAKFVSKKKRLPPADLGTPAKKFRLVSETPLTAPHKVNTGTNEPEILRFRDKFYCRYKLFADFLSTPMRQTRSEAEADFVAVQAELRKHAAALSAEKSLAEQTELLTQFRLFNQTVAFVAATFTRTPQTDNRKQPKPESATKDIFKIRDRFYTSMRLFDQQLSTPLRATMNEALRDKEMLQTEIESVQHAQLRNESDKSKIVSEIKMRISSSYM